MRLARPDAGGRGGAFLHDPALWRGRQRQDQPLPINAGKLIASGTPSQLKHDHIKSPILEVATDNVVEALEKIRVQPWALETSVFGTKLHVMVRDEAEGKVLIERTLAGDGIPVTNIQRIVPSLEDVFLYLLEHDTSSAN